MGTLIPLAELDIASVMRIRSAAASKLLEIAAAQTGMPREALVVREVQPKTDLGLTNEEWKVTYAAAYTEEKHVDVTLPKNKFLVFYGADNVSALPKTLYAKFATPAKTVDIWRFDKIYAYSENPVGFAEIPVIYVGGKTMQIYFYGNATGDDLPRLKGLVVEPLGELIQPGASQK